MTLNELLSTCKTTGIRVVIIDAEYNNLIEFYSEGYASIEADILARTVRRYEFIVSRSASEPVLMKIVINNPVDNTPVETDTNSDTNADG